jgi:hypothetical protein
MVDEGAEVLVQAAGVDPQGVMEAVGNAVLDRHRRTLFGVCVLHGLFEAIGTGPIKAWVERNGRENLRWLTRHFPAPRLNRAGQADLPPITEWLLRERGDGDEAFEWFIMGCHSGGVFTESDVNPDRTRREMEPFLQHELPRVRQWAEQEIRRVEREAAFFRERAEEDERR